MREVESPEVSPRERDRLLERQKGMGGFGYFRGTVLTEAMQELRQLWLYAFKATPIPEEDSEFRDDARDALHGLYPAPVEVRLHAWLKGYKLAILFALERVDRKDPDAHNITREDVKRGWAIACKTQYRAWRVSQC